MSISVDSNNLIFVNDLNPGKNMWNMKARIIQKWNQGYKMDLIFIDEKGAKIHAEDAVVILSKFGVGENKDLYKVVVQPYKINFYSCTTVTPVRDWQDVEYGFNFGAYEDVLQGEALNALSVDVVGSVVCCGDLEIFDRPPKETKKINFDIEDLEGKVLRCTVWNDYALQIKDGISKIPPHEHVMAVIQHGKCKEWKCEYTVQSDKFATRIFLMRKLMKLILKFGKGSGSTSQTILSSQSVFPLHKEFVTDGVKKHTDEISDIEKEMSCVVVATVKIVQEEYDDIVRLPATSLGCPKCHSECTSITTKFKVQVRVQDESVIIAELVGGDGNGDENTDEVTQEVVDVKDVNLSESSQVSAERTSGDAISVTADSSAVEVEKDSGSSPNGKRMAQDADVVNVDELSTNVRRTRKKLSKE
ncbi:uncharacterized protein LOC118479579 [Helianthus annuus]|uniref:uncharacterized protein LOC118479579 n=1 Tax=Helianthus annuus TaxID=4232 RepID=UPI0016533C7C|nr:uncharacterized protein LOC118479579 [Helianthus annuus]